uniref:Uncharacterized protein n=1 Tax=Anguilla anguilla TaxID=7936 RepID=A0A0E9V2D4_ANGAN
MDMMLGCGLSRYLHPYWMICVGIFSCLHTQFLYFQGQNIIVQINMFQYLLEILCIQ